MVINNLIINYEAIERKDAKTLPAYEKTSQIKNWGVEQNRIFYKEENDEGKVVKRTLCKLIWVDKVTRNIETGTIYLEIVFYARKQYHRVLTTRAIYSDKNILQLIEKGADVKMTNYKAIVDFLQIQENYIETTHYEHTSLGWKNTDDLLVYYHAKSHAAKGNVSESSSTYNGSFDIHPSGTFDGWKQTITEQVLGRTQLEFALVLGFSAAVNALLANYRKTMDVIVVHIYGDSSTGKTTAARLAVSSFGEPSNSGLIQNWNATFNALMKIIAGNHGVPLVLDESSTKVNAKFTEIIYQIADGKDKQRLSSEAILKLTETWAGLFISTGEQKLTEQSNQNTGQQVRILEIGNQKWTDSAAHAEAIKNQFNQNNGQAGPVFVQYLIDHFREVEWFEIFDQLKVDVIGAMPTKDGLSERLAEKYAVLQFTAHLMNECFEFEINTEALMDFLVMIDQENMEKRSLETRSYDFLQQKILENQSGFNQAGSNFSGKRCYGSIKKKADYLEVAVLKGVMKEWLKEGKFSSSDVVLKGLKKDGLLDHEANKHSRERKLPNEEGVPAKLTVYVLKMPLDLLESVSASNTTEGTPLVKKKPIRTRMRPDIKTLLTDD